MLCLHALGSPTLSTTAQLALSSTVSEWARYSCGIRCGLARCTAAQGPSLTTRRPGPVPQDADMLAAAQIIARDLFSSQLYLRGAFLCGWHIMPSRYGAVGWGGA